MSADQPFVPVISSTTGQSVSVSAISTASTAGSITVKNAESLLVTNTAAVALYIRMSTEATPAATSLDVAMPSNSWRVFGAPSPFGTYGVAAIGTGFGNGVVIFTPGNGGLA